MIKKLLLFDIDGTLLLTGGAGKNAFDMAFLELFGIPDAWGDTIPDGKTDPRIIEEIAQEKLHRSLTSIEHRSLCESYTNHFRSLIKEPIGFKLMPGVPDILKVLCAQSDLAVGIATGNFEETGWMKLECGGIRNYFRFGGFASDSPSRVDIVQTAIKKAERFLFQKTPFDQIFVIGDTEHDINAAKTLGVKSIAVGAYRLNKSDLLQYEPDFAIEDLQDAEGFLEMING